MTYSNKELLDKVVEVIDRNEKQARLLLVLTRLILKSLSAKTLENVRNKLATENVFLLKVEDFGHDLDAWLDKGLTFDDIIGLLSRELGNYVNVSTKSDLWIN